MAELEIRLTAEQVEFYREDGYLALPCLTTADELERLRAIYDRLFEQRVGREQGNQFDLAGADQDEETASLPQILGPSQYAPELKDSLYWRNALRVAQQLLGPETRYMGEHAILKPPFHGAPTPWHQDEAYWNPALEYNSLSVWMPLQDATVENGCLHFVPRSHRLEVLPHHCIGNDVRVHGLEVDDPETRGIEHAVACPLLAGGITVHHCRTLHYAGPNPTPVPRRAYILGFGTPPVERAEPRDFYWNRAKRTPREERARAWRERQQAQA